MQKVKSPGLWRQKSGRIMLLIKHPVCDSKISILIKKEPNDLLSNLGVKTSLSKIPFFGNILFGRWKHIL